MLLARISSIQTIRRYYQLSASTLLGIPNITQAKWIQQRSLSQQFLPHHPLARRAGLMKDRITTVSLAAS